MGDDEHDDYEKNRRERVTLYWGIDSSGKITGVITSVAAAVVVADVGKREATVMTHAHKSCLQTQSNRAQDNTQ